MAYRLTRSGVQVDSVLDRADAALSPEWSTEEPSAQIVKEDVSFLQGARIVQPLGDGTALTLPATAGAYDALITGNATITITPPASGEIEQRLTIRAGVIARCGAAIDVQDAHLDLPITASTAPRTVTLILGGTDATATLAAVLADASEAVDPLVLEFAGHTERKVVCTFAAGEASTLTFTLTMTSATGEVYLSSATLVGPSPTAGDPILALSLPAGTPDREWLSRDGLQDWALYGRTAGNSVDSKPDATDIGTLTVTGDTLTQATSLAELIFEDAEPALSYQATLAGPRVWWTADGPVDLIPAGGQALVGLVVRASGPTDVRASISRPGAGATEPPVATSIAISSVPTDPAPSIGDTVQYSGTILDQYGGTVTGTIVWSAPDGGGSIDQTGLFTATGAGGPYRIVATYLGIAATTYVSVSTESGGGYLSYTAEDESFASAVNLTTLGTTDWQHLGYADNDDINGKSGVSTIPNPVQLGGTWTQGRWYQTGVKFSWTEGDPTASATDNNGYFDVPTAAKLAGRGWSWTLPADTTRRVVTLWLRSFQVAGTLTATLSDGSDTPVEYVIPAPVSAVWKKIAIAYNAATAGKELVVTWTQNSADGNIGIGALALITEGDAPTVDSVTVSPATSTVVEGQSVSFVVDVLDQYSRRMPLETAAVSVSGGGALDVATIPAGGTVTYTAAADGVGGPYTLTAAVDAVEGTAAITVTDYVAPTELPEITVDQAVYDLALTASMTDTAGLRRTWANLTLAVTAALDPSSTRKAAAISRLKTNLGAALELGNPEGPHGMTDWGVIVRLQCLAIVRNTPAIWDALTSDQQRRCNLYATLCAYIGNMYGNPKFNNGQNALDWISFASYSGVVVPNQRTGPYLIMGAIMYFGSLAAVNVVCQAYNSTWLANEFAALGWTTCATTWNKATRIASLNSGADLCSTVSCNTYTSLGVREPIVNINIGYLDNPYTPENDLFGGLTDPGPLTAATPLNIWWRGVDQLCINRECDDLVDCSWTSSTADCSDRFGHPKPGYTTRHLGEPVMMAEFNYNGKSAMVYASPNASFCGAMYVGLRVLGYWPTGTSEALAVRWRKAADVMQDRSISSWWDPYSGRCVYSARLVDSPTDYDGGFYWQWAKRAIFDATTLVWP